MLGVGLNRGSTSDVVIYFEGGGACWNSLTCEVLQTATGGAFDLKQEIAAYGTSWLLSRTLAGNPIAKANYVLVPYRTGDVHGGDASATYTVAGKPVTWNFAGRSDFAEDLKRLAQRFPSPGRVIVTGSSTGGYGAIFNYASIRQTWPKATSYLIDDSGSPLEANVTPQTQWAQMYSSWNLGALTDPLCACRHAWSPALAAIAKHYPHDRMSLLSFEQDSALPSFYGITAAQFSAALDALATHVIEPAPNVRYYFAPGSGHVLLVDPANFNQGVNLVTWLGQQLDGSPAWKSQHP